MECKVSKIRNRDKFWGGGGVRFGNQEILKREDFQFLGSIIHKDGEIENGVNHKIRVWWMKWRSALAILWDLRIPIKLKEKICNTTIWLAILYGIEFWVVKKQYIHKMSIAEMRMLRCISGST